MTKQSTQVVVEGLKKVLISVEEEVDEEVQRKVEMLIAELQGRKHLPNTDPDAERLDCGFQFFKTNIFNQNPEYFSQLAEGQHPRFLVVACSDSRVSPSVILNFKPGEAFASRNIGNMVPQFDQLRHTEIGAVIEYAVKTLELAEELKELGKALALMYFELQSSFTVGLPTLEFDEPTIIRHVVKNILIMGHSRCGGIERLMSLPDDTQTYDFVDEWVKIGLPAKKKVLEEASDLPFEEQVKLCEKESLRNSMANILTYPFVRSAIVNGSIALRGGYYDFVNGCFEQWKMCTKPCHP